MSVLQKQGTFQVYLSTLNADGSNAIQNGLITVPVQLSGDYHLRINGVSLSGDSFPFDFVPEDFIGEHIPEPLFIQSAEFTSSLSNIKGICILPHVTTLVQPYQDSKQTALRIQQYQVTRYDFSARLTGSLSFFLSVNRPQSFGDPSAASPSYPATRVLDDQTVLWYFQPIIVLDISYKRTDTGFFDA